jgi:SAM-dependent methyltransferase
MIQSPGHQALDWPVWSREPLTIEGGIPRFVACGKYAESFGSQWRRFPRTQLDSRTGLPLSRDRLRRCMGDSLFESLHGKRVLEAGCGAGRFTEVLINAGAYVTSADLSSAVEANAANFPPSDRHRIIQADILELPFLPGQFDVVLCLGVIQHTPDSDTTIRHLYRQLRPGGWLVFDHYTHEIGRWISLGPLYRAWLKRQPKARRWEIIERMVDLFLPLHRHVRSFYPLWFLLCRVSPLTTYYRLLPELPESLQREFSILDTHDSLTDWYKRLRSREEIAGALHDLRATEIDCWLGGNGIEGRCRRPVRKH